MGGGTVGENCKCIQREREPEVLSCMKYPPGASVKMQVLKDGYVRVTVVREMTK